MATTALISDLHLGSGSKTDVLRLEPVLERLIEATTEVDHLVLLGDVLELRDLPLGETLKSPSDSSRPSARRSPAAR